MPAVKLVVTAARLGQHVSQPRWSRPASTRASTRRSSSSSPTASSRPVNSPATATRRFDSGEAIEFYGQGRDTLWTAARTYWLVVGAARPANASRWSPIPRSGGDAGELSRGRDARQRTKYFAALKNGDASNFFGARRRLRPVVTESVTVPHLAASGRPRLQVVLQGVTAGNHQVAISVDGQPMGTCAFAGQAAQTCPFSPVSRCPRGRTTFCWSGRGRRPISRWWPAWRSTTRIPSSPTADALTLTAPPATPVAIAGFSSPDVRVMDVTDPTRPIELVTSVAAARVELRGHGEHARGRPPGRRSTPSRRAAVLAPVVGGRQPAVPPGRSRARGEMVILSHALFMDALGAAGGGAAAAGLVGAAGRPAGRL